MKVKKILRRFGFDVVRYHSFWDDIAKPREIKTILDVGANDGFFAADMRLKFPEARIISFEPLHEVYASLLERMKDDQNFKAYNVALGENFGSITIHHSASHASSSLLPMGELHKKIYPGSVEHTDESVKIERLDDALKDTPLQAPVLVKIDVQGFEAGVIKGGSEVLRKADIILVENSFVTLYEGQLLFGGIHDLLKELGFSYRGRGETHYDPRTKEPIYEDSVFIKN
ncbi:MAG: FkbM family methyltransferase [Patescibacteria group bacterium]